jgi:cytochrome c oxidase subunit 3
VPGTILDRTSDRTRDIAKTGGGGRPPVIIDPHRFGGDGGRGGDHAPGPEERLRRYRLGMALALVAISMLFVGVTAAFLMRQHWGGRLSPDSSLFVRDWIAIPLPFPLLIFNTFVLLASSVTMELARRSAVHAAILGPVLVMPGIRDDEKRSPWLAATIVLGTAFLAGQTTAWRWVAAQGVLQTSRTAASFFYLLTVTHALHLAVGLMVLIYAAVATLVHKPVVSRRITVDVASWYWHTMGLLWVYIMILLAVVR